MAKKVEETKTLTPKTGKNVEKATAFGILNDNGVWKLNKITYYVDGLGFTIETLREDKDYVLVFEQFKIEVAKTFIQ